MFEVTLSLYRLHQLQSAAGGPAKTRPILCLGVESLSGLRIQVSEVWLYWEIVSRL